MSLSPYQKKKNDRMKSIALAMYMSGEFPLRELAKQMEKIYGFKKTREWYRLQFKDLASLDN